jgi:hypothetical protein
MNWLDQVLGGSQGDLSGMATLDPEFARITNQRKMLEMLRQTGQGLGGKGQMVGGGGGGGKWHSRPEIYVPESNAGTALAQGAMGYMAGRGNQVLDQQEGSAMQDKQRRMQEWVREYGPNAGGAQPAQMPSMNPPSMGGAQPADMGKSPLGKSVAALSGDLEPRLKAAVPQGSLSEGEQIVPYSDDEARMMAEALARSKVAGAKGGSAIPQAYKQAVGMDTAAQWANEDADYLKNMLSLESGTPAMDETPMPAANAISEADYLANQLAMDPGNLPQSGTFDTTVSSGQGNFDLTPGEIAMPEPLATVDIPQTPAAAPIAPSRQPTVAAAAQQEAGAPAALPQSVASAGMSDDDKLKWLLRGSIQGIPAANLMINQAGNNLLTGEQRREAATALANQKFEQQFALQAERLKNAAELAASKATSAAELAKIRHEYAMKLEEMRLSLQAAMFNEKMRVGHFNRPAGKGGSGGGAGGAGGAGAGGVPGTGALERMDQINEQLKESGGLVDTERGTLPNLSTAISNTPMGQTIRRATGNENQALLDEAASLRNNILLDLKAETGLGTGSLNSNMELTTWLNSLGSEHMSYQARRNIMGNIREFIFRVQVARDKNGGRLPPEIEAGESPPPLTPEEKAMFMRQQGGGQTAPSSGGTAVGTVKQFTSGTYRKVRPGPDNDKATWEKM